MVTKLDKKTIDSSLGWYKARSMGLPVKSDCLLPYFDYYHTMKCLILIFSHTSIVANIVNVENKTR